MRFPPPSPPLERGLYGYGYRLDGGGGGGEDADGEGEGFNAKLGDEIYIRSWREQSLSHMALIDDGDDDQLLQLAGNIRPFPF